MNNENNLSKDPIALLYLEGVDMQEGIHDVHALVLGRKQKRTSAL